VVSFMQRLLQINEASKRCQARGRSHQDDTSLCRGRQSICGESSGQVLPGLQQVSAAALHAHLRKKISVNEKKQGQTGTNGIVIEVSVAYPTRTRNTQLLQKAFNRLRGGLHET